jgi:hypothetical protein
MFKLSTASSVVVSSESCGESTADGSPEEEEEEEEGENVPAAVKTRQLRRILHTLFCSPSTLLRGKETSAKSLLNSLLEAWSPSPCGNRKREEAEEQQQLLLLLCHPLIRTCMGLPSLRMKFSTPLTSLSLSLSLSHTHTHREEENYEQSQRKQQCENQRNHARGERTRTPRRRRRREAKSGFNELSQFWNQARVRV